MKKTLLSALLVVLAATIGFSQTKMVTFQVSSPDSLPVHVFGSWSNWSNYPGTLMTSIGNNVYTATLPLPVGANYEYLFVNGATTFAKETLNPAASCTNGNAQYTNRTLGLGMNDTTICSTWASCAACNAPAGSILVTFQVSSPDSLPVHVFGSWSNWSNYPGDAMTSIGNNIYSVTLPLTSATSYEYLFVNGTTPTKEALSPTFACTNGNAQYTNRTLTTATTASQTLCNLWATCNACQVVVLTPVQFPATFEDPTVAYNLTDFGGNASSIVTDPTNPNNKVAETIKSATAELWAGTTLGGTVGFGQNIPFTATNAKMNMRVWSPDAGIQVRLKVEDPNDPTKSVETEATTTAAGAWQTLTFDFANQAAGTAAINLTYNYRKASIFFNFGVTGAQAGVKTYYWDDVQFGSVVVVTPLQFPVTFEDATVAYNLGDFGGNVSAIITDPTNPNNKVVETTKSATAELWAGTTLGTPGGFAQNVPFTATNTKMNMRVWSPDAGIQVRLKIEDPNDATKSVETEATTTAANAWQTLTFDFANQAAGTAAINFAYNYRKASAFFNFGTTGAQAGVKTYYWDDVQFGSAVSAQDISKNQVRIALNKNGFTLLSDELKEVDNIVICDVVGRAVYTSPAKVAVNTPIDVTLNSNTVYFITVKTNNVASTFKAIITQ